jgi:hypothetical protein
MKLHKLIMPLLLVMPLMAAAQEIKTSQKPKVEIIKNRNGQTEYCREPIHNGYILRDRSGSVVVKAIYRQNKTYLYDRSGKLTNIIANKQ